MDINYYDVVRHYCDLNDIPYHNSRDAVIDYIVSNPTHHITYQTPYKRVFVMMYDLITGKIDLATLMNSGDITHPYKGGIDLSGETQCIVSDVSISGIALTREITNIILQ